MKRSIILLMGAVCSLGFVSCSREDLSVLSQNPVQNARELPAEEGDSLSTPCVDLTSYDGVFTLKASFSTSTKDGLIMC